LRFTNESREVLYEGAGRGIYDKITKEEKITKRGSRGVV